MIPFILVSVGAYLIGNSNEIETFDNGGQTDSLKLFKWQKQNDYDYILKKGFDYEEAYERYSDLIDEIKDEVPSFPNIKGFFKSYITKDGLSTGIIVASDTEEALSIASLADQIWYGQYFSYKNGQLYEI